jgi:hypothetical protein
MSPRQPRVIALGGPTNELHCLQESSCWGRRRVGAHRPRGSGAGGRGAATAVSAPRRSLSSTAAATDLLRPARCPHHGLRLRGRRRHRGGLNHPVRYSRYHLTHGRRPWAARTRVPRCAVAETTISAMDSRRPGSGPADPAGRVTRRIVRFKCHPVHDAEEASR